MGENNPLKERCRRVLDVTDKKLRYSKKLQLRAWAIKDFRAIDNVMIDELSREELGLYMAYGAVGDHYNYSLDRIRKMKAGTLKIAEGQQPGDPLTLQNKPSIDETKGLDQLSEDLVIKMIGNTGDEDLVTFTEMIVTEISKRHPKPSPDVT